MYKFKIGLRVLYIMTQKSLVSQLLVYEFIVHILLHYATYAHANSMQLVNIIP